MDLRHVTADELAAGLDAVRESPRDEGRLEMIVSRPAVGERIVLDEGALDLAEGLVGDSWRTRQSSRTEDGTPHPDMQLNLMNARVIALVAQDRARWPLAGDQLFVDLDLTEANLPPGTWLEIGSAVIEVTNQPHTGCGKFVERFGVEAMKFVNSPVGRELHLRGINAKVVRPGRIRAGDRIVKRAPDFE
jgi:hypothetical protein